MIEQYLLSLEGLARFQTISIVLFFAAFCAVAVWVFRLNRSLVDRMASLPLDDSRTPDSSHEVLP